MLVESSLLQMMTRCALSQRDEADGLKGVCGFRVSCFVFEKPKKGNHFNTPSSFPRYFRPNPQINMKLAVLLAVIQAAVAFHMGQIGKCG